MVPSASIRGQISGGFEKFHDTQVLFFWPTLRGDETGGEMETFIIRSRQETGSHSW
jgi:hypothetical protein